MSTSDPTPLAQRLTRIAWQATVQNRHRGYDTIGNAVAGAVLREVGAEVMRRVLANEDPIDLTDLADSIEKGGTDGR